MRENIFFLSSFLKLINIILVNGESGLTKVIKWL